MDRLSDYDYNLPEERIAQTPLAYRADSKLLLLDKSSGEIQDRVFRDVVDILRPDDLLVWNDTRVTALRLFGNKPTGAVVEALLLSQTAPRVFQALVKPGKRLKPGARIEFAGGLKATVGPELEEAGKELVFDESPDFDTN